MNIIGNIHYYLGKRAIIRIQIYGIRTRYIYNHIVIEWYIYMYSLVKYGHKLTL